MCLGGSDSLMLGDKQFVAVFTPYENDYYTAV